MSQLLQDFEVKEQLVAWNVNDLSIETPAQFTRKILHDFGDWAKAAKDFNIQRQSTRSQNA